MLVVACPPPHEEPVDKGSARMDVNGSLTVYKMLV